MLTWAAQICDRPGATIARVQEKFLPRDHHDFQQARKKRPQTLSEPLKQFKVICQRLLNDLEFGAHLSKDSFLHNIVTVYAEEGEEVSPEFLREVNAEQILGSFPFDRRTQFAVRFIYEYYCTRCQES